ncbi:SAM-dependent methyltransferase [Thalassovita taeanensis]|uniref:Methyltransferase domain-containing protein n=1 Tax=Thalassovita taeanensis TaxID=657014 RepID=A0A1H9KU43_9RHOB|nr:class I SAM-dependent methyltransferase [Thalassovita taeanensis]SER02694.1 Methyltransferase domain-containing protein [Thalassovita taeanensis]
MWEERFATPEYVFGKHPARFLTEHAALLTPGATALSVADGEGRNSVYLAQQGMDVTALEFSPSAIAKARTLAAERGVSVTFQQQDVLSHDWPTPYDLVAGIFIQFVGPQDRKRLFDGMKQSVRPGGLILLHGYTPDQIALGTGGPPFVENMYTDEILRAAFVGWDILECRSYTREVQEGRGHSGQSALLDFVARKPA